jgi:Zn-dependent peptidase ImmA (M78 family)/DNA-binding XRE family transcriptional regulator
MDEGNMKEIIADNIRRFRSSRGLTQERLAELAGVDRITINNYENGRSLPGGKVLYSLSVALQVSIDSLMQTQPNITQFLFRAHENYIKKDHFTAAVNKILNDYLALESFVGAHPYMPEAVPCDRLQGNEGLVNEISDKFRQRLNLGTDPIPNLFRVAENIGIKCIRTPIEDNLFFGLSAFSEKDGAFILLNSKNTIERQIFSLAHEIGHLIFHRHEYNNNVNAPGLSDESKEEVANQFANHFLMPERTFDEFITSTINFIEIKKYFRVSYRVVLKRLSEKNIGTYDELKQKVYSWYLQYKGEPLADEAEIEPALQLADFPENERFKNLVFQSLKDEQITYNRAAELLHIGVHDVIKDLESRNEIVHSA